MEWIKRSDQEPEDNTDIFIWKNEPSEGGSVGWYCGTFKNGGLYVFGSMKSKPLKIFSHWMPEMLSPKEC